MITELDKQTALVLIDLQKGILAGDKAHPMEGVLNNAAALVEGFHEASLPVVIVNVNPAGAAWTRSRKDAQMPASKMPDNFTEIVDEVPTRPDDLFVTKHTWNAFFETELHEELQKRNVTGIVLGGVSTSIGVEGTARAAAELGYNVSFATDAMTDRVLEAHNNSLQYIFPRIGESGTTKDILNRLPQKG
jgi:nicotinamidase-related amidase